MDFLVFLANYEILNEAGLTETVSTADYQVIELIIEMRAELPRETERWADVRRPMVSTAPIPSTPSA